MRGMWAGSRLLTLHHITTNSWKLTTRLAGLQIQLTIVLSTPNHFNGSRLSWEKPKVAPTHFTSLHYLTHCCLKFPNTFTFRGLWSLGCWLQLQWGCPFIRCDCQCLLTGQRFALLFPLWCYQKMSMKKTSKNPPWHFRNIVNVR